ncbi:MAG: DUF6089 family protein [Bacteroidota bacterium]
MRRLLAFLFCCTALLFMPTDTQAQRGWEGGGWIGISNYCGDLNTNFDLDQPGIATGVNARYNFNERVCLKFSGNLANVSADDSNSRNAFERARNLNFQSQIWDGAAQLEFNFLPYLHGSRESFLSPYLFGGFNVFNFNPQTIYEDQIVDLRPLRTEGQFIEYANTRLGFVYGLGMKISFNYRWSINIEISGRALGTDYLDDVSTVFADPDDVENQTGTIGAALSNRSLEVAGVDNADFSPGRQRGNSFNNDSYIMTGISLMYYFGDLMCPSISGRR